MKWYVVHTHPREEAVARNQLVRQGFATYLPVYLKRRSHARRVENIPSPLFPRYLFVEFDIASAAWRAIRSTRGVVDLIRNGPDPVAVPEGIISDIRNRESAEGYVVLGRYLKLEKGAHFRIGSGAFASQLAIFEEARDKERVIALLSLLGREVSVELPIGAIAPVS